MLSDSFFDQISVCDNDQEILMKLIKMITPDVDEGAFSHAVEHQFGGIMGIFSANYSKLAKNNAIGETLASFIKYMQVIFARTLRAKIRNRDIIKNISQLYEYLLFKNHTLCEERLTILLLNSRNHLIREEIVANGTANRVIFHHQMIIRHIVDSSATAFILVHNHQSGDPTPSQDDIEHTQELNEICNKLSISFHDHIIVGDGYTYSMRENRLFK